MGLFDFVKDAGERLFGGGDDTPEVTQRDLTDVLADKQKAGSLTKLVQGMGLKVEDLDIKFRDGVAQVSGKTASQAEREKLVLMVGNTQGVAQVDDDGLQVAANVVPETSDAVEAEVKTEMYTVKSGDSLSKIAKEFYGDAMKYPVIFEANKPMLKNPDRIYPGQVLRIPRLDG